MVPSARSIPASPSMPAGSILILPMSIGAPLRLAPTAGECLDARQCGSVDAPGMLPLPVPERGGSIEALPVLPQSFEPGRLCVGRRMAAGRVAIEWSPIRCSQYPASRARRRQFYQSSSGRWSIPMRLQSERAPREERELMISPHNGHRLLSIICPACRPGSPMHSAGLRAVAVSRSGSSTPMMKRCSFKAARPTVLNGIEDIIGRSDLVDRAILLTLGPIGEEQRRSETELWREFELARPAILGALLDAAAHGLRAVGSVHLGRLPRMADFALWATASAKQVSAPASTFTRAYAANRKAAIES